MFVWTISDVIGLGIWALIGLFAIVFVVCHYASKAWANIKRAFRSKP